MRENTSQRQSIVHQAARNTYRASSPVPRLVQRELLDELPATDPHAVRSRRDLQRVNWWMGNAVKAARAVTANRSGPWRVTELGAGDGTFFLGLARLLGSGWRGGQALLLDRQRLVST